LGWPDLRATGHQQAECRGQEKLFDM